MCHGAYKYEGFLPTEDASSPDLLVVAPTLEKVCNRESSTKQFWQSVAKLWMIKRRTIS